MKKSAIPIAVAILLAAVAAPAMSAECPFVDIVGDRATVVDQADPPKWELHIRWAEWESGPEKVPSHSEVCPLQVAGTGLTQRVADCPQTGSQLVGFRGLNDKSKQADVMAFYGLVWFRTCK